jgi:ElaB/YqjD/DUF883 family membrane-anchored ribosome-binding protein
LIRRALIYYHQPHNQQQEFAMLDTTRNTRSIDDSVQNATADVKVLVKDAQALLTAAASLTGVKADELRSRGMELLDRAMGKASQYQGQAVIKSKELAETADVYVKDNPWRTVAAAASLGLLVGIYLGRK